MCDLNPEWNTLKTHIDPILSSFRFGFRLSKCDKSGCGKLRFHFNGTDNSLN